MYEGLRVGNLDMAVLYNPDASPDLEMATLYEDELVLISPKKPMGDAIRAGKTAPRKKKQSPAPEKIALADIAALPLILPSRPNAFRLLIDNDMATLGLRPQVMMEVDGLNAILSLVKEGMGHAVLPRYTLSNFDNVEPFAVRNIHNPRILSRLELVWSSRRPATATQKKALEVVRQVVLASISA
jgi:LysR family nitrogen assimilation transcriptional regulator